jgi:hypothetical protein
MRWLQLCLFGLISGCAADSGAPPQVTPEQRQVITANLAQLKARVTADTPQGLFVSLRNTHVEVREFGGAVEGAGRTSADVQDFGKVSEAVVAPFLEGGELDAFKQRLREALSPNASSTLRAEYARLAVTLTRTPLRLVFALRQAAED